MSNHNAGCNDCFCARNEGASLLMNLEEAFGRCIPSKEDIKREVGTTANIFSAVAMFMFHMYGCAFCVTVRRAVLASSNLCTLCRMLSGAVVCV